MTLDVTVEEDRSPETAEHAGYHHVQDDKLLPFHLSPGESERDSAKD